jgi:hypothetical protein
VLVAPKRLFACWTWVAAGLAVFEAPKIELEVAAGWEAAAPKVLPVVASWGTEVEVFAAAFSDPKRLPPAGG